jgi:Cu-processing system permease protein
VNTSGEHLDTRLSSSNVPSSVRHDSGLIKRLGVGLIRFAYGVLTIAHLTWMEARRRRIALAAVVCGFAFLLVFAGAVFFLMRTPAWSASAERSLLMRQMQLEFLTLAGLYVVNFLTVAMAVLLPVDTLSGEISSGVMQTLASKPVSRSQIVLGKWLTYWLMTGAYLALMAGGIILVVQGFTGFVQPHMARALPLMWLDATVLLTVSIAGGTRFTTVTNGIVAFALYGIAFIGGWVEQIGVFLGNDVARYIGTTISLVSPTDALWRLAAYQLLPPVMSQLQLTPFSSVSVPSPAMVGWALGYITVVLLAALRNFEKRPL